MKKGQKVKYTGKASDEQVNWGENDDPRIHLVTNKDYTIDNIIIHSWHTKISLKEIPGKEFNSLHFKPKTLMSKRGK